VEASFYSTSSSIVPLGLNDPCSQWSTSALIHHCGTWTHEVAGSVFSGDVTVGLVSTCRYVVGH